MTEELELNTAICVYLKNYPGQNVEQFDEAFGDRAELLRGSVREILTEAIKIELDWTGLTLSDGGGAVEAIMAERHPGLAPQALNALRRYYTYQVR